MPNAIAAGLDGIKWRLLGGIIIVGAAFIAFAPALASQFIGDDWGFLAISRQLDSPLAFYFYDHSSSYFYRPNAMVLWWLSSELLGLNPAAHYGLNLCLHALNALLLCAIALRATRSLWIAVAAASLFALHPVAIGTSLWLADRFDLAATAAVLWALLALERAIAGDGHRLWIVLAAAIAAGCKEIAVVLPVVAALRLAIATERSWRWRGATLAGIVAPLLLMLAARQQILKGVESTLRITDLLPAAVRGVDFWLAQAGSAIVVPGAPPGVALAVLLLLLIAGALASWRGPARSSATTALTLLGISLAILPALVQWPVTQLVLAAPDALLNPVNLRFYYLALVGLMMAAAGAAAATDARSTRGALLVLALGAALIWLPASRQRAVMWAEASSGPNRVVAEAAARMVSGLQLNPGCTVHLLGTREVAPAFGGVADAAVKAQVPRGAPALDCTILTERAPFYAMTREAQCNDAAWMPLHPRASGGRTLNARRVGNLCYHYFADPGPASDFSASARWFQWQGGEFREIPVDHASGETPSR